MARIRKTNGRRKLEIKKISKESSLRVTFSKRHNGLFKKASELSTLCAAECALIIFSPGNKVISFGHSSVQYVVNRFLTGVPTQTSGSTQVIEANHNANVHNLNAQLTQLLELLDIEKNHGLILDTLMRPSLEQCWWASPIEEMNMPQLELLKAPIKELIRFLTLQADWIRFQGPNPPQFLAGSSSNPVARQEEAPLQMNQPLTLPVNQIFDGNMMPPLPDGHGQNNKKGFYPKFY